MNHRHIGWQTSPLTDLQKSYVSPGVDEDGGPSKRYVQVVVVDDQILSKSADEQPVFLNLSDARAALADALQRGDAVVKAQDLALFDLGKVRRAVIERIYDAAGLRLNLDGTPMVKSRGAVAARAEAHAASQMGAHHSADPVRAMLAQHRGATVGNATPHRFEASAHQDGSCAACGHRETQAGANHFAKSSEAEVVTKAYRAYDPMGNMRDAVRELDELVEKLDRDR